MSSEASAHLRRREDGAVICLHPSVKQPKWGKKRQECGHPQAIGLEVRCHECGMDHDLVDVVAETIGPDLREYENFVRELQTRTIIKLSWDISLKLAQHLQDLPPRAIPEYLKKYAAYLWDNGWFCFYTRGWGWIAMRCSLGEKYGWDELSVVIGQYRVPGVAPTQIELPWGYDIWIELIIGNELLHGRPVAPYFTPYHDREEWFREGELCQGGHRVQRHVPVDQQAYALLFFRVPQDKDMPN